MKTASNTKKIVFCAYLLVSTYLLAGCGATGKTEDDPECRTEEDTSCNAEGEKDRSYDPCLVNKNLPVCRS